VLFNQYSSIRETLVCALIDIVDEICGQYLFAALRRPCVGAVARTPGASIIGHIKRRRAAGLHPQFDLPALANLNLIAPP
jgi:hypothetical protein